MASLTWPFHSRRVGTGLASVVGIFAFVVACLLLLTDARTRILSSVRAYVAGEGLYSKGQKDAVNHLVRYSQSHDPRDYQQYLETLAIPLGDRTARLELEKPSPDMKVVYDGFVAGHNHPDDVADMAMLFRRFRRVSYIDMAIGVWAAADGLVARLAELGDELHSAIASKQVDEASARRVLTEVHVLNAQLTMLEDEFSRTLGEGNRWLAWRLARVTYAVTAGLLFAALVLSWTIYRRVNAADQALRAQAERWRVTLASIADAVLVTDAEGGVVALNSVAARLTGCTEAEAIGSDVDDVFRVRAAAAAASIESAPRRALRESVVVGQSDQSILVAKDGREMPIDESAAPIKDEQGATLGAVLVFRDVSERRQAGETLRRSEERYRSLISMTTAIVFTTDPDGMIVTPHPAWEAYTGQRGHDYLPTGWETAMHPDDRDRVIAEWSAALLNPALFRCETRLYHAASGRYRHCVAYAVPLFTADGRVREWIGTWTDVDERKSAEESLQAADRQKDQYLAMLAHELRNPLAPIRNAVHVLRHVVADNTAAGEAYEIIDRQATYMARLLDDLLDVSRIARGKISLRNAIVDFATLTRHTTEDYRATLEQAGVALSVDVPPHPIWVDGDPTRLAEVLSNLLHNASKFTEGTASVEVVLRSIDGTAVLVVRDTGIGMRAEHVARVFDAFTQADQSLDRSRGGLGIGLALVKGLVDLHGGTVTAESAGMGEGSTFTVRLPIVPAPSVVATVAALPRDDRPTRPLRVLVVEDNRDLAASMLRLLELGGHHALAAHTGAEALDIVRSFVPEVVLCDIGLPGGMNGYDLAVTLRDSPALASVFLIALTGYGRPEDRRRVKEAGFDMHMVKPVDPVLLANLLARRGATQVDAGAVRPSST